MPAFVLLEPLRFKIEQLSAFRKELILSNLGQFDSTAICAALFGSMIVFPAWCPHGCAHRAGGSRLWLRMKLGSGAQSLRRNISRAK